MTNHQSRQAGTLADPPSAKVRARKIQTVLRRVLYLNLLVAVAKMAIGLLTGTLAMLADGFHSLMDASSNVIGLAGTAIAARPPDADHPYGHQRFETVATLAIGALLLVAAWEILKTALDRLVNGSHAEVTPLNFAVMLGTMAVNFGVAVYETGRGTALRSDFLLADATQTRVDLFISASVIVGLVFTGLGFAWMDTVIGLVIVVLIGRAAFTILSQTTQVLVDAAPLDPDSISRVVAGVPGVTEVIRVRSRGPVDAIYADIDVRIQPATTADHAASIANEISDRVTANLDGIAEVQVHFAPQHDQPQDRSLVVRAAADALGLSVHEITEILTADGITLEMHVEVPPQLTLAAAHTQVSELEQRVCTALPEIHDVITHIEPSSRHSSPIIQTASAISQRDRALEIAKRLYPDAHWHAATIRPVLGGYAVTLHCWLPGTANVQEAHAIAEDVETQIRSSLPQIQRVTIHTEPPEAAIRPS